MRKSIINSIALFTLLTAIVLSLGFSVNGLSKVKCSALRIVINEDSPRFLDEEEIENIIKQTNKTLFEEKLSTINTNELEKKLEKVASIKKAEVFRKITGTDLAFKGQIVAEIEQRRPIARIIPGDQNYYLDSEGIKILPNDNFTVKVVVVNGIVSERFAIDKLLPLVRFIDEDKFWNAMIGQVFVKQNEELVLVTQIGDQLIEFGEPDRIAEKFRNLKALYQQVFAESGWGKYKSINLKYRNQVVCTKK